MTLLQCILCSCLLIVRLSFVSLFKAKRSFNVSKDNDQATVHFTKPKPAVVPKLQAPPAPPPTTATAADTKTQPTPAPRACPKKPPPRKPGLKAPNCPPPLPPPSIAQWEQWCMCEFFLFLYIFKDERCNGCLVKYSWNICVTLHLHFELIC